jgi:pimeloyl-ACP methyl ester carboxylesterase
MLRVRRGERTRRTIDPTVGALVRLNRPGARGFQEETNTKRLIGSAIAVLGAAAFAELGIRPAAEFATLLASPVYWGGGVSRGDGHSVMVIPGLFAGDSYLAPLRNWLGRMGYLPLRSGLDFNPGWSEELVNQLGERAEAEYKRSGSAITIIGHSMGGLLAHSVAEGRPHAIRHVISLGSPLDQATTRLSAGVRISSIYTRDDLIVRHPRGLASDAHAEHFEVRGSHAGLAFNPHVYRLFGELLLPNRPAVSVTLT